MLLKRNIIGEVHKNLVITAVTKLIKIDQKID